MGRFSKKYADENVSTLAKAPLQNVATTKQRTRVLNPVKEELKSIKIKASAYQKLDMMKSVSKLKHLELLSAAVDAYAVQLAEKNPMLKRMLDLLSTPQEVEGQMSIEDFLIESESENG